MIEDLKHCSEREVNKQISYLSRTPVRGIAALLGNGQCNLKRGTIRSLRYLGNLKTEFGEIDRLIPPTTDGEKKFRVSEVVSTLIANPDVNDDGLLLFIESFIKKDRKGEVEYNVTIFDYDSEFIIKDGNKRLIAFYENRKNSGNDIIEFPVYVVSPAYYGI
jgi:hypothetical protein